jgi:transcriptional regulator with XRE-family HTH domain
VTNVFGRWLRQQLVRHQMSITTFASKIGVSHSSVSLWVEGKRVPNPKSCDKIADVLLVPLDEVLALAGHRPRDIGPDVPSDAVQRLQPLIDQVQWTDGFYELIERQLKMFRDAQRGMYLPKTASWEMKSTEGVKITNFDEFEENEERVKGRNSNAGEK